MTATEAPGYNGFSVTKWTDASGDHEVDIAPDGSYTHTLNGGFPDFGTPGAALNFSAGGQLSITDSDPNAAITVGTALTSVDIAALTSVPTSDLSSVPLAGTTGATLTVEAPDVNLTFSGTGGSYGRGNVVNLASAVDTSITGGGFTLTGVSGANAIVNAAPPIALDGTTIDQIMAGGGLVSISNNITPGPNGPTNTVTINGAGNGSSSLPAAETVLAAGNLTLSLMSAAANPTPITVINAGISAIKLIENNTTNTVTTLDKALSVVGAGLSIYNGSSTPQVDLKMSPSGAAIR